MSDSFYESDEACMRAALERIARLRDNDLTDHQAIVLAENIASNALAETKDESCAS